MSAAAVNLARDVLPRRRPDAGLARGIGFTEHATYRDETDPSVVAARGVAVARGRRDHVGSLRADGAVDNVGGSAAYLVNDDPDEVFRPPWTPGRRSCARWSSRTTAAGEAAWPIRRATTGPSAATSRSSLRPWQPGQYAGRPSSTRTCASTCSTGWRRWSSGR